MIKRSEFDQIIASTGILHSRMPAGKDSLEEQLRKKSIANSLPLWDGLSTASWIKTGHGQISLQDKGILSLQCPARSEKWPEESPDGDYSAFGHLQASFIPEQTDWRPYNRLHFKIRPECLGMHSPMIALQLYNEGEEKIPDKYFREGYHMIHLKNHEWNDCIWEFPILPRDCVTSLSFLVHSYGQEVSMDDSLSFLLKDISLEYTYSPEHTLGWCGKSDRIVFSTEGYWLDGSKTAVSFAPVSSFSIYDQTSSKEVFRGIPIEIINEKGRFYLLDFSSLNQEGTYYIKTACFTGSPFTITANPLYESVWKVVHFLYCERCGGPLLGGHGTCHTDILARHNGVSLPYCGGWHDAGDVSQQTLQTGEVVASLLEIAARIKDHEPVLYYRIMEEAAWGLDFVLRMRFGDGYRATSAGIRRWSNGLIGDMDDCEARVHNHAFENFLLSGVEAAAALSFRELDPALSWKAYHCACEDYRFALKQFEEKGMELPSFYEHTYHSSLSQYYAAASYSASAIYGVEQDRFFADQAAAFGSLLLSCQETGRQDCPLSGFFYREPDKKTIVHFNHQSREHLFMQALVALCRTQPAHRDKDVWENAMHLYGEYVKNIYSYAAPYGLLPAGIHKMDEYLDEETFSLLHLMTTFEEDSKNYKEQLEKGISLNENYCIRMFPVWFSFRGNTAIHLSSGKAASLLGLYFNDNELIEIAREQLYWIFGKNPFGQSLIYGAGSNYAQQYGALNGEMAGSLPVGIETRRNDDIPFWPMENCATYKEVWTTSAGRWLSVAADLY